MYNILCMAGELIGMGWSLGVVNQEKCLVHVFEIVLWLKSLMVSWTRIITSGSGLSFRTVLLEYTRIILDHY